MRRVAVGLLAALWACHESAPRVAAPLATMPVPLDPASPLRGPRMFAMRYDRGCAVDSRARVVCFSGWSAPALVAGVDDAAEVVVGAQNACARMRDGRVACWGDNVYGEQGPGRRGGPTVLEGLPPAEELATLTYGTVCARAADGVVWCWGKTLRDEVPSYAEEYTLWPPAPIPELGRARRLFGGHFGVCAVGEEARCTAGALDRAQRGIHYFPNPLTAIAEARAVAVGFVHGCLVHPDGRVSCWGENTSRQLGDGSTETRATPVVVPGITDAVDVAVGDRHTCVLHGSGKVSCFGAPAAAEATKAPTPTLTVPADVGITGAVALGAEAGKSCALLRDRSIVCWGGRFTNGATDTPEWVSPRKIGALE